MQDKFMASMKPCFASDDKEAFAAGISEALGPFVKVLGSNTYMCGNKLSIVDFFLFEWANYAERLNDGSILDTYPTLRKHQSMMKELSGVKEFIAADHEHQKVYLPPFAKCQL